MKKTNFISILIFSVLCLFIFCNCGSISNSESSSKEIAKKPIDGIAPLFDEGMDFYNIQPSIISENNNEYHIYYTVNKTEKSKDSVIAYRKATIDGNKVEYSEKKIVLEPSSQGWDTNNYCNCDVIKGMFSFNKDTYSYLMAYQANASSIEKEFEIGFAVAKTADGPFVKIGNPVIGYDSVKYGYSWGCGQPSLVSYDKQGKIYLFYTMGDILSTQTYVAEIDASNLNELVGNNVSSSVSTDGLIESGVYIMLNDADFSIDKENGLLYTVRNLNPVSSTAPNLNSAVQVAKMPLEDLYKPDSRWEIVEEKVNMLDLETENSDGWERVYSACIFSDVYGNIYLTAEKNISLGLTVTSYDKENFDYLYYQTITIFTLS